MAINDTYLLSVKGKVSTQDHVHTLHFRCLAPTETAEDLVVDWQANAQTAYRAMFRTGDFPIQVIRAEMICGTEPLEAPHEVGVAGATGEGTKLHTDQRLPSFLAALIREKGTLAGRTRQGRFFIGGMGEDDITEEAWTGTYVTALQGYMTALTTRYIGVAPPGLWRLVVHSRKLGDQLPALQCDVSSTPVASLSLSPVATTMRSRKIGHGS